MSATIPAQYRLVPGLTFSYDGAIDSKNGCPKCGAPMDWHDLMPFGDLRLMECEECDVLCDVRTEQVWQLPQPEPRHIMTICGAMREVIERNLRVPERTPTAELLDGYLDLDKLCTELEKAIVFGQLEQSVKAGAR